MERVEGFPRGPFALSKKFLVRRWLTVVLAGLGSVAILAVYARMAWQGANGIWHDQRVWAAGGLEGPAKVSGEVTTRQFVLKSYRLKVEYVTPDGVSHQHELEFDTLFGGMDEQSEQLVRLTPNQLDDFAFGPAVEAATPRYFAVLFFLLAGGGIAVAVAVLALATYRQLVRVSAAARQGVLRPTPLVHRERVVVNGRDSGAEKVIFRLTRPDGSPVDVTWQLRTKGDQLLVADEGRALLALVPPDPLQAIALLESFYPLALPAADESRTRSALASWRP
jgi:hypothetical protein